MNPIESLKNLFEMSKEYVDMKIELGKLKIVDKSAAVSSTLITLVALLLIAFLAVGLLSIGLALWIGKLMDNSYWGFAVVGGFYLVLLIIFYLLRVKWIKKPLAENLIHEMLN